VKDKEKQREYCRRWWQKHRLELMKKRAETLEVLRALKEHTPCMDCRKNYPYYIMEFDHREPALKAADVDSLLCKRWEYIAAEVDKCDIVCANCHCARTWKRRQLLSLLTTESGASTTPTLSVPMQ
jgi:hypothetical protein